MNDTTQPVGSHHGTPALSQKDMDLCQAMVLWIDTARKAGYNADWLPQYPDILKSRLFWRIRSGKEPLPTPPPRAYSCPWYEVVEEADRPHWAYEAWFDTDGHMVSVAQCSYVILNHKPKGSPLIEGTWLIRYGDYHFHLWYGQNDCPYYDPVTKTAGLKKVPGWWIQLAPLEEIVLDKLAD